MPKTYGQFCGLARALDHVGDRWTLLVVRELLLGDASYGDLRRALGDVATNLLAARLRDLEADDIVTREQSGEDRRRATYRLTPLGRGLEPAVAALIVWGSHWMREGPGDDRFHPSWARLALRALLSGRGSDLSGVVRLGCDGVEVFIRGHGRGTPTAALEGADHDADAIVEGPPELLLALASGQLGVEDAEAGGLRVEGDRAKVRALFAA